MFDNERKVNDKYLKSYTNKTSPKPKSVTYKIVYYAILTVVVLVCLILLFLLFIQFLLLFREHIPLHTLPWLYVLVYGVSVGLVYFLAKIAIKKIKAHPYLKRFIVSLNEDNK